MKMNTKAEILHENVIFIILNVVFFSVMLVFIYLQSSSVHLMEEETAKQVTLLIDAAKPGTDISIYLKDFFKEAEENGVERVRSIEIDKEKNLVVVRGSDKSFYEYGYFNDGVYVGYNIKEDEDYLFLVIKEKKNE